MWRYNYVYNVDVQVTRLPMVLVCCHWEFCHGEVGETCSPSPACFHEIEASCSRYVGEVEEKRGILLLSWCLTRAAGFCVVPVVFGYRCLCLQDFPFLPFGCEKIPQLLVMLVLLPTSRGVTNICCA